MDPIEALKNAHGRGIVLGLKDALGVAPRLDIDVLIRDQPQTFNLFILAMTELSSEEAASEIFGYYQIAGIHGLPKTYWDGVQGKENVNTPGENVQSGYCAHNSVLFPTWHRPYIAMMEQAFFLTMWDIAGKYTDPKIRANYQEAAKKFRFPYWDYFRPRGGPVSFPGIINNGMTTFPYDFSAPETFTQSRIQVRMHPNNELRVIENPFFQFKFPENPQVAIAASDWTDLNLSRLEFPRSTTVRYPRPQNIARGWSGNRAMNAVLNSLRMDLCRVFLNIMEDDAYFDYDDFATQGVPTRAPGRNPTPAARFAWAAASGSLEALHGIYHGLCGGDSLPNASGGGGHMSVPGVAGFDPIFWVHHCQVDRMFAIWQAATQGKTESWFNSEESRQLADADLLPSRKSRGVVGSEFWTSGDSRRTADFGYQYQDAVGTREQVLKRLHDLYNWSVPLVQANPNARAPANFSPIEVLSTEFFAFNRGPLPPRFAPQVSVSSTGAEGTSEGALISLAAAAPAAFTKISNAIVQPASEPEAAVKPSDDGGHAHEWFIDDRVQRLALNGSFTTFYFISDREDGSGPNRDTDWALEPSLAGISHVFAAPSHHCDNCGLQEAQAKIVSNTVPITSLLLDFVRVGALPNLEPDNVKPFLIKRLKWRVIKINGEVVDPRVLAADKDLQINVSCKKSQLPRNSGVAEYTEYPDIIAAIVGSSSELIST